MLGVGSRKISPVILPRNDRQATPAPTIGEVGRVYIFLSHYLKEPEQPFEIGVWIPQPEMASQPRTPGIMWVNSDVIKSDALARKDFDRWYCDEHIPDVVTKSGVESANRYDHMINGPAGPRRLGFLTIYEMPDINFMETEEFRGLEGQSPGPNRDTIFANAEFDTRSYELVQVDEAQGMQGSGRYLLGGHV